MKKRLVGTILVLCMVMSILPVRLSTMVFASNNEVGQFDDVKQEDWYYEAVDYVNFNGLMNGVGNNNFGPDDALSRPTLDKLIKEHTG